MMGMPTCTYISRTSSKALRVNAHTNPALKFGSVTELPLMRSYRKQKLTRADSKCLESHTLMAFVDWHLT